MLYISLSYYAIFLSLLSTCWSFNLEERVPLLKHGPTGSLFGLSVVQHYVSENASSIADAVLLVGAPTADDQSGTNSDSYRPGALFGCKISTNQNDCRSLVEDNTANTVKRNNSNQWLGVSVKTEKPGGKVMVCAHRFTQRVSTSSGITAEALLGRCYLFDSNLLPERKFMWEPCDGETDPDGSYSFEYYGYCQAGTSVAFANNDEEDIVFGVPGPFHWKGGINAKRTLQNPLDFSDYNVWSTNDEVLSTITKNGYLGFSLATGLLYGTNVSFIAGAPRGNDTGVIYIFEKHTEEGKEPILRIREILSGEILASSYGYDVKIIDVTGDGRDDLIVGAPQYYDRNNKIGGAVYIYINKGTDRIGPDPTKILYGNLESSFGSSITSVGDINMDGVNDIAIGAPGADKGAGAVYIYHGNSDPDLGVFSTPTQVLKGATLTASGMLSKNMSGFGYSVNGGLDMDFNGYPDLLIGSLSDTAVLYRTRPIVNVQASIKASVAKININPKQSESTIEVTKNNKQYKIVTYNISVCMKYTSTPTTFDEAVGMKYTVKLDVMRLENHLRSRATFNPYEQQGMKSAEMKLYPQSSGLSNCTPIPVYLNTEIQDKLSPIIMSLSFDVLNNEIATNVPQSNLIDLNQYPILNAIVPNETSTQVNISKECGPDEICNSNLKMEAHYVVLPNDKDKWRPLSTGEDGLPLLLVGTEKEIGIRVKVTNAFPGEDAHQAKLTIFLPDFLQYIGLTNIKATGAIASCTIVPGNSSLVACDLGNPFRANSSISMVIRLQADSELYRVNMFTAQLKISTSSKQPEVDFIAFDALVRVQAQLVIDGYPGRGQIPFSGTVVGESAIKKAQDAGPYVEHIYQIENTGNHEVADVFVNISWPQQIKNGKWLFYLLEAKLSGAGNKTDCNLSAQSYNPLNLKYERAPDDLISNDQRRKKRQASTESSVQPGTLQSPEVKPPTSSYQTLTCSDSAKCLYFTCSIGNIKRQKKVFLYLRGVVWNSTFLEEFNGVANVKVFSEAKVWVNRENILYADSSILSFGVPTSVQAEKIIVPEQKVEWYIIALATLGGVILLVIIVLLLWRCGFFKRRRDFGDYHKARRHKQASRKADESSDRMLY